MEFSESTLYVVISLLTALFITSVAIPTIVRVASMKGLISAPNGRTSHKGNIPLLGGLALFLGFGISTSVWTTHMDFHEFHGIFAAAMILAAIGLKDDILIIDPIKKLIGEIMAAGILVWFAGIKFTSLQGIFGFHELGFAVSLAFSVLVVIIIINAFNLIDGIDGLAAGIGILATLVFGYWFYRVEEIPMAILSFSTAGALAGFFYFNVLGGRNKIFMGDTGSLLLGMVLAILSIRFCELNLTITSSYRMESAPVIAIALLSIPLFDMTRVFAIRIFSRRSPFRADKNHIHHVLLGFHLTHLESTLILLALHTVIVLTAIALRTMNMVFLAVILFGIYLLFCSVVTLLKRRKQVFRTEPLDLQQTVLGKIVLPQRVQAYGQQEGSRWSQLLYSSSLSEEEMHEQEEENEPLPVE